MEDEYNLPSDWENPKWDVYDSVHGWRNYVSDDVIKEWPNFTDYQKKILAISFQNCADSEHWD